MTLLLGGCDSTPPSAYNHWRDGFFAVVPLPMIDADFEACFRTIDGEPGRLSDSECYRLMKPERMRGVVITGFETGAFFPERTALPKPGERSDFWVKPDPSLLAADVRSDCSERCALYLEFIGRRTAVEGSYGHMGLAKHIIVVDRVLRASVLG